MVGLTSVLLSGLSGMRASQTAMATISQNIANANTPGYVRTEMTLAPRTQIGAGAGGEITGIKRAADQFLATANYIASASAGSASARADLLSRAQQNFGDPSSASSMFGMVDEYWSALTQLGVDPSSSLRRSDAVSALQATYSEIQRIGDSLQQLIGEADQRMEADAHRLVLLGDPTADYWALAFVVCPLEIRAQGAEAVERIVRSLKLVPAHPS